MEVLYRIEEFTTTGWELINEREVQLTRDICSENVQHYLGSGMSPDRLRVVIDV
jgi:hypothetical protein